MYTVRVQPEDPWEMNNLADDPKFADPLRRMTEHLAAWQERTGDPWAYRPVIPPTPNPKGIWGNWND